MNPVELLRSDLSAAGYTVPALAGLWGPDAAEALHRDHRVPARRALDALRAGRSELPAVAVLADLFVLGRAVTLPELAVAFPSLGVQGAADLGFVSIDAGQARAALDLRPYSFEDTAGAGSWWIASDLGELATGGALPEDHVLGVGGASLTLSGLMFQAPVDSVLDLGTGCGIQALHAARHARRVVATDISERALVIAAMNAALNGFENIEFRLGSLFDPVAGERFDRIVSNPPFVITPRVEGVPSYEYRDGGMVGDALVEAVLTGVAEHLEPGGTAQLLGNWEYHDGDDGLPRVRAWLDSVGLDYWIVEREVLSAALYAETWIRDGGTTPATPDFDRLYAAWLDDFAERGVSGVGFGYVVLRMPRAGASVTLTRTEQQHGPLGDIEPRGVGAHLEAGLAASDWLAATDDAALSAARLTVAGDVTEERHYWPGDENPTAMLLRQGGGFGRAVTLDTALAALIGACDGELSVGAICAALAQLLEVDETALTADLLPAVRELVLDGILSPSSSSRG